MAGQLELPGRQTRSRAIMTWVEMPVCADVDELAARMDVSRSWVLRRALIEYLEREGVG